jgi:hypothetical protein
MSFTGKLTPRNVYGIENGYSKVRLFVSLPPMIDDRKPKERVLIKSHPLLQHFIEPAARTSGNGDPFHVWVQLAALFSSACRLGSVAD